MEFIPTSSKSILTSLAQQVPQICDVRRGWSERKGESSECADGMKGRSHSSHVIMKFILVTKIVQMTCAYDLQKSPRPRLAHS